ncbi:MAG: hypothetical protein WKF65_02860 [Gaiellaceae bacterium]
MRSWLERVADDAFVVVTVAAGAVAVLAAVLLPGLVLGGSACGGGGNAQRCTGIARQLSLVGVSPHAWAYVAGGTVCILLGAAALLLTRHRVARIVLSLAVLTVAFIGLVQTTRVDAKLGPSGGGTYGRQLEDWGAFLSPALRELRQDALRRYGGRQTEPGGPRYDREQILASFSVREQDGWRFLYTAVVVVFFAAGLETVRRVVRRPTLPHRDDFDCRLGCLGDDRRQGNPVRSRCVRVLSRAHDDPGRGGRCARLGRVSRGHPRRSWRRPPGLTHEAPAKGPRAA